LIGIRIRAVHANYSPSPFAAGKVAVDTALHHWIQLAAHRISPADRTEKGFMLRLRRLVASVLRRVEARSRVRVEDTNSGLATVAAMTEGDELCNAIEKGAGSQHFFS
jgi:hypothetical protein